MKIQTKKDGTFIVDFNGQPFHVTPEYPPAEQYGEEMTHAAIAAHAQAHPEEITEYQEPVFTMPEAAEEQQTLMRITALEAKAQRLMPTIQAGIDAEHNRQLLIDCMLEIEELKGNI